MIVIALILIRQRNLSEILCFYNTVYD